MVPICNELYICGKKFHCLVTTVKYLSYKNFLFDGLDHFLMCVSCLCQVPSGLSGLCPDQIYINLTPQTTLYKTGSIHFHRVCTMSLNSADSTQGPTTHWYTVLFMDIPSSWLLNTVCSPYIQQLLNIYKYVLQLKACLHQCFNRDQIEIRSSSIWSKLMSVFAQANLGRLIAIGSGLSPGMK